MAESTVVLTVTDFWHDSKRIHVIGSIAIGASPGTYSSGGVALDPNAKIGSQVPGIGLEQPVSFRADGVSGYKYEYKASTKKLIVRALGDHTHDLLFIAGITATEPVAIAGGDTLGKNAATNRTIAGSASATKGGVVTSGVLALSEIAASAMPAGVSGDTIGFTAIFKPLR